MPPIKGEIMRISIDKAGGSACQEKKGVHGKRVHQARQPPHPASCTPRLLLSGDGLEPWCHTHSEGLAGGDRMRGGSHHGGDIRTGCSAAGTPCVSRTERSGTPPDCPAGSDNVLCSWGRTTLPRAESKELGVTILHNSWVIPSSRATAPFSSTAPALNLLVFFLFPPPSRYSCPPHDIFTCCSLILKCSSFSLLFKLFLGNQQVATSSVQETLLS